MQNMSLILYLKTNDVSSIQYQFAVQFMLNIIGSFYYLHRFFKYLLNYTNGNNLCSVAVIKLRIERRMIMANIENKENTSRPISKTTD